MYSADETLTYSSCYSYVQARQPPTIVHMVRTSTNHPCPLCPILEA